MSFAPTVMVSSTFYDLHHLRASLAQFLTDHVGYVPLLSELHSFPVNPDLDTVQNCVKRVETNADIFVLIIGGRYGTVDERTDKSITNLEYAAARRKGLPIYVFVERNVLALLPTWRKNPNADFTHAVDTPRLFEFLESVRSQEKVWAFPFDTPQDIIDTLRTQLAHLFRESLTARSRLAGTGIPAYFATLSPKALSIVLEGKALWEYRLFFQCWIDEVARRADALREYNDDLAIDLAEYIPASNGTAWLETRLYELDNLVGKSLNQLFSVSAQTAFGPPGVAGDGEYIVWVASRVGMVLERLLTWSRRIRCARVEEPFNELSADLALMPKDVISQLQEFPRESLRSMEEQLASTPPDGSPRTITLTFEPKLSNLEGYRAALERVRVRYLGTATTRKASL